MDAFISAGAMLMADGIVVRGLDESGPLAALLLTGILCASVSVLSAAAMARLYGKNGGDGKKEDDGDDVRDEA